MSKRMKALQKFTLRGNKVAVGDVFPVKDSDVALLTRVKYAEEVNDESKGESKTAVPALTTQDAPKPQPANESAEASKAEPKAEHEAPAEKNLDGMTMVELKAYAEELGLKNVSGLRKAELLTKVRRGRYGRRDMRAE